MLRGISVGPGAAGEPGDRAVLVADRQHGAVAEMVEQGAPCGAAREPGGNDRGVLVAEAAKMVGQHFPAAGRAADPPLLRRPVAEPAGAEVAGHPAGFEVAGEEPFGVGQHLASPAASLHPDLRRKHGRSGRGDSSFSFRRQSALCRRRRGQDLRTATRPPERRGQRDVELAADPLRGCHDPLPRRQHGRLRLGALVAARPAGHRRKPEASFCAKTAAHDERHRTGFHALGAAAAGRAGARHRHGRPVQQHMAQFVRQRRDRAGRVQAGPDPDPPPGPQGHRVAPAAGLPLHGEPLAAGQPP